MTTQNVNDYVTIVFTDKEFKVDTKTIDMIKETKNDTLVGVLLKYTNDKVIEINRSGKYFQEILDIYCKKSKSYCDYICKLKDADEKDNDGKCEDRDTALAKYFDELNYYGLIFSNKIDPKDCINLLDSKKMIINNLTKIGLSGSFVDSVMEINGIMSGSFVLQTYLNADWNSNDIDIYMESDIFSCHFYDWITGYSYGHKLPLGFGMEKSNLIALNRSQDNYDDTLCEFLELFLKDTFGEDVSNIVVKKVEKDSGYSTCSYFNKLIKFKINNVNIDLILCKCRPFSAICQFDFDFNKIYFDGYTIGAMNWKAIHSKTSWNNFMIDRTIDRNNISNESRYFDLLFY